MKLGLDVKMGESLNRKKHIFKKLQLYREKLHQEILEAANSILSNKNKIINQLLLIGFTMMPKNVNEKLSFTGLKPNFFNFLETT